MCYSKDARDISKYVEMNAIHVTEKRYFQTKEYSGHQEDLQSLFKRKKNHFFRRNYIVINMCDRLTSLHWLYIIIQSKHNTLIKFLLLLFFILRNHMSATKCQLWVSIYQARGLIAQDNTGMNGK